MSERMILSDLFPKVTLKAHDECDHVYTKCWGGYHCLDCMTYFPKMVRYEPRGVINWNVQA